jgi:hypothetical protein
MTDNFFRGCPAVMSDGRFLSDHLASTRRDEYIKYINDITRDDQYRLFLQTNGGEIIFRERLYNLMNNKCNANVCIHKYPTRALPRHYVQEMQDHNYANSIMFKKKEYFNNMSTFPNYDCKHNNEYY